MLKIVILLLRSKMRFLGLMLTCFFLLLDSNAQACMPVGIGSPEHITFKERKTSLSVSEKEGLENKKRIFIGKIESRISDGGYYKVIVGIKNINKNELIFSPILENNLCGFDEKIGQTWLIGTDFDNELFLPCNTNDVECVDAENRRLLTPFHIQRYMLVDEDGNITNPALVEQLEALYGYKIDKSEATDIKK